MQDLEGNFATAWANTIILKKLQSWGKDLLKVR